MVEGRRTHIVRVPAADRDARIGQHVARLRERGPVIYITFCRGVADLRTRLGAGSDLFFVDVTGHGPPGVAFGQDAFYIDSPVKLEKVGMTLNRVTQRLADATVVVDDLGTVSQYNGPGPMMEFVHLLTTRCAQHGQSLDLVVVGDDAMIAQMEHLSDAVQRLEAA